MPVLLRCKGLIGIAALLWQSGAVRAELTQTQPLPPGKVAEECLMLQAGEKLRYAYDSTEPLLFNIHYHVDESVHYPVRPAERQQQSETSFTAALAQTYCLMWENTNKTASALLNYRIERVRK